jgi:hypothetical protein
MTNASPAQAVSAKLYVANNGTDNTDCGPKDKLPCRSISRAIAHANAGDQIIVGPGLYGDLNGDGTVNPSGNSGEEAPVTAMIGTTSYTAIVNIDKQLTVVSRDGAGATVIDTAGISSSIGVHPAAGGVVFGKTGKGFTVRRAAIGVWVDSASGVKVQGNVAEACTSYGFQVGTQSTTILAGTMLKGNVATNNRAGA